jgi:hypothetical protein
MILGNINGKILLSIVFFIFLTPIAFISKLFNKDGLQLKKTNKSYYQDRNHQYSAKDFENTW